MLRDVLRIKTAISSLEQAKRPTERRIFFRAGSAFAKPSGDTARAAFSLRLRDARLQVAQKCVRSRLSRLLHVSAGTFFGAITSMASGRYVCTASIVFTP